MLYNEKLPFIIVIVGFIIFAISGLVMVLTASNAGIKMDAYLCNIQKSPLYTKDDGFSFWYENYAREHIYNRSETASEICAYKKLNNKGQLTPMDYINCQTVYKEVTKSRFKNGECKQLAKKIVIKNNIQCEALYVLGTKNLVRIKCDGGTESSRKTAAENIKRKYK